MEECSISDTSNLSCILKPQFRMELFKMPAIMPIIAERPLRFIFSIGICDKITAMSEEIELHYGHPFSMEGRQEREIRVYAYLDQLGIEYWQTDHKKEAYTMEDCEDVDAILHATVCKNLFLCNHQKTQFYLLMMVGDKKFKTKDVSHQLGVARLSFADEAYMEKYLDIHPGAVSVMGLMNDHDKHVRLIVDRDILKGEYIGCHPCVNTSSLKIRTKDIFEKFVPSTGHDYTVVTID